MVLIDGVLDARTAGLILVHLYHRRRGKDLSAIEVPLAEESSVENVHTHKQNSWHLPRAVDYPLDHTRKNLSASCQAVSATFSTNSSFHDFPLTISAMRPPMCIETPP